MNVNDKFSSDNTDAKREALNIHGYESENESSSNESMADDFEQIFDHLKPKINIENREIVTILPSDEESSEETTNDTDQNIDKFQDYHILQNNYMNYTDSFLTGNEIVASTSGIEVHKEYKEQDIESKKKRKIQSNHQISSNSQKLNLSNLIVPLSIQRKSTIDNIKQINSTASSSDKNNQNIQKEGKKIVTTPIDRNLMSRHFLSVFGNRFYEQTESTSRKKVNFLHCLSRNMQEKKLNSNIKNTKKDVIKNLSSFKDLSYVELIILATFAPHNIQTFKKNEEEIKNMENKNATIPIDRAAMNIFFIYIFGYNFWKQIEGTVEEKEQFLKIVSKNIQEKQVNLNDAKNITITKEDVIMNLYSYKNLNFVELGILGMFAPENIQNFQQNRKICNQNVSAENINEKTATPENKNQTLHTPIGRIAMRNVFIQVFSKKFWEQTDDINHKKKVFLNNLSLTVQKKEKRKDITITKEDVIKKLSICKDLNDIEQGILATFSPGSIQNLLKIGEKIKLKASENQNQNIQKVLEIEKNALVLKDKTKPDQNDIRELNQQLHENKNLQNKFEQHMPQENENIQILSETFTIIQVPTDGLRKTNEISQITTTDHNKLFKQNINSATNSYTNQRYEDSFECKINCKSKKYEQSWYKGVKPRASGKGHTILKILFFGTTIYYACKYCRRFFTSYDVNHITVIKLTDRFEEVLFSLH